MILLKETDAIQCSRCKCFKGDINVTALFTPKDPKNYPYFPTSKSYCITCLRHIENEFIDSLTIEEIPKWISHQWFFISSTLIYTNKLKTDLGNSIP